jgi:hypothetical protein
MRTLNRPDWDNQPIRLNEEEKKDLYLVLDDFFSCFHLQDAREMLYDWLVAALSSECGTYSTGYARSNLIFVYEKIELLIEAAHGLQRKRRKSLKRKQRHEERR